MTERPRDPLHGQTLEMILSQLVARLGWVELGELINIRCFKIDPSVKSSLKFLRKTPWARKQVEELFVATLDDPTDSPLSPWSQWHDLRRKQQVDVHGEPRAPMERDRAADDD